MSQTLLIKVVSEKCDIYSFRLVSLETLIERYAREVTTSLKPML